MKELDKEKEAKLARKFWDGMSRAEKRNNGAVIALFLASWVTDIQLGRDCADKSKYIRMCSKIKQSAIFQAARVEGFELVEIEKKESSKLSELVSRVKEKMGIGNLIIRPSKQGSQYTILYDGKEIEKVSSSRGAYILEERVKNEYCKLFRPTFTF